MLHPLSRQVARRLALNCPRASHARRPTTRGLATAAPNAFDWQDPLRWSALLTDEERAISETAEAYCQERLQPRVLEAYRSETYPREILHEMGALGLLGAHLRAPGCAGASSVAGGLIARAVERVDSGFRSAMSVQGSLVMGALAEWGSAEQQERWMPRLASGEISGCFGLTEPGFGSDPGGMESVARQAPGGGWKVSGSKTWITSSPIADLLVVWAKLADSGRIKGFVIERAKCPPGTLETPPIKQKTGLRASITGMIHLDDCPVPAENMLPGADGLSGPFACLNSARYGIAWGVMGALEDCLSRARSYALERKQFKGNPLARYQLVQKKLADAATDVSYGLLAALQVGRLKDAGQAAPEMISMIKRQNCDRALEGARKLQEIFGGNAVADEYHIGRHVANIFVAQTYEGTSDIHCRAITGIQAFC